MTNSGPTRLWRGSDEFYNTIDLNHIFNDNDILDEWIRGGEQLILPSDDLSWLDENIRRSDGSGGDNDDGDGDGGDDDNNRGNSGADERICDVGGSQRGGAISWIQIIMPHKIQIMEADQRFRNSVGIWIG